MEPFYNNDIAIEILSRLPTNSLMAFKCTSTKWNNFISDPSFLHIHYQRSYDIVGLIIQNRNTNTEELCFISLVNKERVIETTTFDFLPKKGIILASSNGLICYRSYFNARGRPVDQLNQDARRQLVLYICDPTRKEWIAIRRGVCCDNPVFGLASYPFGSSSNPNPHFKLVNLQCLGNNQNVYTFSIYSSVTRRWKMCYTIITCKSEIHQTRVCFVNDRLHFLTSKHQMITFHVEKELAQVIKLPGVQPFQGDHWPNGNCFGESEGHLHYVCVSTKELHVWVLKDYGNPAWEHKHCLPLLDFYEENSSLLHTNGLLNHLTKLSSGYPDHHFNLCLEPLAFHNEVLHMRLFSLCLSYNFKSRKLITHCNIEQMEHINFNCSINFACHVNLVPLEKFAPVAVKSNCKQGRRQVTLPNNDHIDGSQGDEVAIRTSQLPIKKRYR